MSVLVKFRAGYSGRHAPGKCKDCAAPCPGSSRCVTCGERHRERERERRASLRKAKLCTKCGGEVERRRKMCAACLDYYAKRNSGRAR